MDQTLLKYWKTCLQDAERKAIALKGPRITLNIGDKILKVGSINSIFYFLHKAAEPFNCLEQDNLA